MTELERRVDQRLRDCLDRMQANEVREREIRRARQIGADPQPVHMNEGHGMTASPFPVDAALPADSGGVSAPIHLEEAA